MASYNAKIDFLLSALDMHIVTAASPAEAWYKALEDYQAVYHTDDGRTELARAADRALRHLEAHVEHAQQLRVSVQWRPVEWGHDLPPTGQTVLTVWRHKIATDPIITLGHRDVRQRWFDIEGGTEGDAWRVTHWAPRPDLPKETPNHKEDTDR